MATYPPHGLTDWDDDLKTYIDQNAAETVAPATELARLASTAKAEQLDRTWRDGIREGAARALVDYTDAAGGSTDFTSTTAGGFVPAASNAQVSGNKLFAQSATGAGGGVLPLGTTPLQPGEYLHAQWLAGYKAGAASPFYSGLDLTAPGTAPDSGGVNMLTLGISGANLRSFFFGSGITGLAATSTPVAYGGGNPVTDTIYQYTLDIDELYGSLVMQNIANPVDKQVVRFRRAALVAGSKPIGNIRVSTVDARALGGHWYGPITFTRSLQKTRTPVLGGQVIEGQETYHAIRTSPDNGTELWDRQFPKNWDPRKPLDIVVFGHQTVTGSNTTPFADVRMQPLTLALNNAGLGVVSLLDGALGADRFGNQLSLDNHAAYIKWLRQNFNIGRIFYLTASGGAFPILNMVARGVGPTPSAICLIGPGISLDGVWNSADQATFRPLIRNAYGISDDSEYAAKTAGYDPMLQATNSMRGVPMLFMTTDSDPTAPKSVHVTPFVTKFGPYLTEATVVTKPMAGHLQTDVYDPTIIVPFFQKYQ